MYKSTFYIAEMDCPGEEHLVRMKLADDESVSHLDFDIACQTLTVTHSGDVADIASKLRSLNLGSKLRDTVTTDSDGDALPDSPVRQRKALRAVLAINFAFFVIEVGSGIIAESMGLVADSLDMLADALVYGMSLMAVGAAVTGKKRVALLSGLLQIILALLGLSEVIRRFVGTEQMPHFRTMIGISLLALIANAVCLRILQRTQSKEAHIRASVIFSANDVVINAGVIVAGVLVWLSGSRFPDLIIGVIVFLIVIRGAIRILKLAK